MEVNPDPSFWIWKVWVGLCQLKLIPDSKWLEKSRSRSSTLWKFRFKICVKRVNVYQVSKNLVRKNLKGKILHFPGIWVFLILVTRKHAFWNLLKSYHKILNVLKLLEAVRLRLFRANLVSNLPEKPNIWWFFIRFAVFPGFGSKNLIVRFCLQKTLFSSSSFARDRESVRLGVMDSGP